MSDDRSSGSLATMNIRPRPDCDIDANRFPDPTASREKILDGYERFVGQLTESLRKV